MSQQAIFRLLIVFLLATHVWFVFFSQGVHIGYETVPGWFYGLFYTVIALLAASLLGLFFLKPQFRFLYAFGIVLALFCVYSQGYSGYEPAPHLVLQIGCGLHGAVLALSFLGQLRWNNGT